MFHGKAHYTWQFSIAMFINYLRLNSHNSPLTFTFFNASKLRAKCCRPWSWTRQWPVNGLWRSVWKSRRFPESWSSSGNSWDILGYYLWGCICTRYTIGILLWDIPTDIFTQWILLLIWDITMYMTEICTYTIGILLKYVQENHPCSWDLNIGFSMKSTPVTIMLQWDFNRDVNVKNNELENHHFLSENFTMSIMVKLTLISIAFC